MGSPRAVLPITHRLAGAVLGVSIVISPAGWAGTVDVLTSRGDLGRTGANLRETLLTVDNVASASFRRLFHYDLVDDDGRPGGDVYAQPLIITHVGIPKKGVRNVVLVATTNNLVLALDADGQTKNDDGILWRRQLGSPPTINQMLQGATCIAIPEGGVDRQHVGIGDARLCQNITPGKHVGILSTPVVDRGKRAIFLVARTRDASGIHHNLHALDLGTGHDLPGSPVEISGSTSGVTFQPEYQNQRVGLALSKGHVIVAFGSHEDKQPYRGWVMSYRFDGSGFTQTGIFVTTPTGDTSGGCFWTVNNCAHGGIWQSGRAPAVDPDGRVLLFVGNGKNDLQSGPANKNFGNSFVALNPVSLAVLDFFTPANHSIPEFIRVRTSVFGAETTFDVPTHQGHGINELDLDLGGSGPMIVPGSPFVVGGGKQGVMHVWRMDSLGGFSPTDASVVQKFPVGEERPIADFDGEDSVPHLPPPTTTHAGHIMGGPVFWPRAAALGGSLLFHWAEDSELRSYAVDTSASVPINPDPVAKGSFYLHGHPGGILSFSANRSRNGSGIVWASVYDYQHDDKGALHNVRPGILKAYAADDLRELWSSDAHAGDKIGNFAKFVAPTVANGRVYVATFSDQLVVYGLHPHQYERPAAEIFSQSTLPLLTDPLDE